MVIIFIVLALLGIIYGVGGLIANLVSRKNYEDYQAQPDNRRGDPPQVFDFPLTKLTAVLNQDNLLKLWIYIEFNI